MSCKASCFHLECVSKIEVLLLLEGLDKKKSLGLDKIHPILLATAAIVIYQPLTHIINLSIKQCIFPRSLKIAKVIAVFKQCSRTSCHNYRPISVLSALSKIFEECILNQLVFYFTMEDFMIPNQYGFRQGRTTTECLVDLLNKVTTALDNNLYPLPLFLDLSKAFDTVNYSVLLPKLAFYGIENVENQWFRSYLQNRKQRVFVNGHLSEYALLNSGVPQ